MAEVTSSSSDGLVCVVWATASGSPGTASELLRAEVARVVGIPLEAVRLSRSCPQCGSSDHGRPVVLPVGTAPPPFVSLGRADGVVVAAVSRAGPVGVDVEPFDGPRFAGFGAVALHHDEVAATIEERATSWVRKESLLKATGDGLGVDPRLIRLSSPDLPPRLVEWCVPGRPSPDVVMWDIDVPGHASCVTVLTTDPTRVSLRQAAREALPR